MKRILQRKINCPYCGYLQEVILELADDGTGSTGSWPSVSIDKQCVVCGKLLRESVNDPRQLLTEN